MDEEEAASLGCSLVVPFSVLPLSCSLVVTNDAVF